MQTLISLDPIHRQPLGDVPITSVQAIAEIVDNAKHAHKSWSALTLNERQTLVSNAYQHAAKFQDEMTVLISKEMGKDYRRASYEAAGTIQNASYFVQEIGQALQSEALGHNAELQYRSLGVVAVISPWNYPLAMANNLLLPALIVGNSVILKPSEETPLVADLFVKVLNEVLPAGVLQIAHGDETVGKALVELTLTWSRLRALWLQERTSWPMRRKV